MKKKETVSIFKLALFLFATVGMISFAFYFYQIVYAPNVLVDGQKTVIIIKGDDDFKSIQKKLHDGRVVNDIVSFSFLSKLMSYDENVKPGRYILEPNMTNLQAIRMLRAGRATPIQITFNSIRTLDELAKRITRDLLVSPEEFTAALANYLNTNKKGFTKETVISMFIPNTYEVYYTTTADELIERMEGEYEKFWSEDRLEKAKKLNMSPVEVSTLASIVQAESNKSDEKPIIAGLYLNRLEINMALQADPTVKFALGDFGLKRVLKVHTQVDSPYNTYRNTGLPPGPINMPSISSIDAVLNPSNHDYIYMVAKEDFSGYHNFAVDYNDHLRNAAKYQRQLTIEQRKARENKK